MLRKERKEVLGCEPLQSILSPSLYRGDILHDQHVVALQKLIMELIQNVVVFIDPNRQRMKHVIQV